jgi:hypothetical protein
MAPSEFMEAGCAVCGLLCKVKEMKLLSEIDINLNPLMVLGVTRLERKSNLDEIKDIPGPVMDSDCKHICKKCLSYLQKNKMPPMSLANGMWLGKIPHVLLHLNYIEKLLVARVRHNRCIIRVKSSGRYKMRANAIVFDNPTPEIYNVLPRPIEELEEVLAVMFTGPCRPTKEDLKRTPLLVRRNVVAKALHWLVLNHCDYANVEISQENLSYKL